MTSHNIEVWTVMVDETSGSCWLPLNKMLDKAEGARATRLAFERHRREFVVAHALKRLMLSAIDGKPPQTWTFETLPGGKPRVGPMPGPKFNLSHTEALVACAVSQNVEIGIDVEYVNRKAPLELAEPSFTPAEKRWIARLAGPKQSLGFFRLWTLKEAYIKATGRGFVQPLHEFGFSFDPLQMTFYDRAPGAEAWYFDQRPVGRRHLLALAWRAEGRDDVSVAFRELSLEMVLDTATHWISKSY